MTGEPDRPEGPARTFEGVLGMLAKDAGPKGIKYNYTKMYL